MLPKTIYDKIIGIFFTVSANRNEPGLQSNIPVPTSLDASQTMRCEV